MSHATPTPAPRRPAPATWLLTALTTLTLAACAGDPVTGPGPQDRSPGRPSAYVAAGGLTTGPLLYGQSAASGPSTSVTAFAANRAGTQYAADFTVPAGAVWPVSQVLIPGVLPAATLSFAIHDDHGGRPGNVVHSYVLAPAQSAVQAPEGFTDYLFALPAPAVLAAGTYWLVVDMGAVDMGRNSANYFRWQSRGSITAAAPHGRLATDPAWGAITGFDTDLAFALYAALVPHGQTVTMSSSPPIPAVVAGTYEVQAAATSGLAVAVSASPAGVCTASGSTVTFVGVGTCIVAADQAGDATYAAAERATQTIPVDYAFAGFASPVENDGVLNSAKAGQAIPLKWRLTDASGAPVTTLAAASVTVEGLACSLANTANQVGEDAAGSSGLQHVGDGYYQLNWKSAAEYARSCKTVKLDLGEGSGPRTARFQFTR